MRYFLYCRKSTDAEDRQVLSLASQEGEMSQLAERWGDASIVEVLSEARSAKAPGRHVFGDMLRRIEEGEAEGIIAWHADRLARNMVDGGQIIHLIDTGKIKDLRFANSRFENTPQGKLNLAIQFTFSKYYVDELSENVRRGMRMRAQLGWAPGRAPMGYVTDKATKPREICADPERFELVTRMWRLLLSGQHTPSRILRIANNEWGFRTPRTRKTGGGPLSRSALYKIFSHPFYAGVFPYRGQLWPGKHKPMITLDEFERAQQLLGKKDRPRAVRRSFAYTGLIHCACGLCVTAEEKTNRFGSRYIYYHCTRRRATSICRYPCIRAAALEAEMATAIDRIHLHPFAKDWLTRRLGRFEAGKMRESETKIDGLDGAIAAAAKELDQLTQLRVRSFISDEEFLRQRETLDRRRLALTQRREKASQAKDWIEPAKMLLEFNSRAAELFRESKPAIKRLVLATVGSNLVLAGKTFSIEAKKPFRRWEETPPVSTMCTFVDDVRTLWAKRDPEYLAILDQIRLINHVLKEPDALHLSQFGKKSGSSLSSLQQQLRKKRGAA